MCKDCIVHKKVPLDSLPLAPKVKEVMFSHLFVCLLLAKSKIFQVYWFVDFVILSVCLYVCLFVCLSPAGHNSEPIVVKLYQVVEVVSTEKPIDFEVKFLILRSNFWNRHFSSDWFEIWTRFAYCVTELGNQLFLRSNGQRSTQGQTSKIMNFYLKNRRFSSDCLENQTAIA